MPLPLEGRLVLDFSTLLPGPLATLMLAEAGAEVIKIERPGGEDMRAFGPRWGDVSAPFALLNRGKTCVAIDLKNPRHRARLEPLIARADILVEQFRPGVMARLGLDYASVAARNPGLIYCSITGYGQAGPDAQRVGHDLNYIAETGLLALSHGPDSAPTLPPAQIADIGGGTFPAVINILLALIERERTGKGRHLDIAMTDAMFTFAALAQATGQASGRWPRNGQDLLTGGRARYGVYPTRDGKLLAVGAVEDKFWQVVCDVVGLPAELRADDAHPASKAGLAGLIAAEPAQVWAERFADKEACVSVVARLEEAMTRPHTVARGLFEHRVSNGRGDTMAALALPIDPGLRAAPDTRSVPQLDEGPGAEAPVAR